MATWTASLKNPTKNPDNLTWSFEIDYLRDGVVQITEPFSRVSSIDLPSIKRLVKKRVQQYQNLEDIDLNSFVGPLDLSDPTPDPPTQEEIDLSNWLIDVAIVKKVQDADGIFLDIQNPPAAYSTKLASVTAAFDALSNADKIKYLEAWSGNF